ncbi:hypothetical protein TNCV_3654831 [Trichonephila clavipes]|nr:hypothetical protein TNCV_3654831 [Trichonephila clavipes]
MESKKGSIICYTFHKNSTAAAACRNVCQVYEDDAIGERMYRRWFRKFRDRSCQDQARSGRPSHFGEGDIDQGTTQTHPYKNCRRPSAYTGQQSRYGWLTWVLRERGIVRVQHNLAVKQSPPTVSCYPSTKMTHS